MKERRLCQRLAEQAYRARKRGIKRIPGILLTDEQAEQVELLAKHHGSKTAGILAAIEQEAKRLAQEGPNNEKENPHEPSAIGEAVQR